MRHQTESAEDRQVAATPAPASGLGPAGDQSRTSRRIIGAVLTERSYEWPIRRHQAPWRRPGNTGARGLDAQIAPSYVHEAHHGRPASWVTTAIVIVGFVIGGIALPVGPVWWLFWLGTGIVVLGAIFGAAVHIFDDWY